MKKLITTSLIMLSVFSCGQKGDSGQSDSVLTQNLEEASGNKPNYSHLDLYSFSNNLKKPLKADLRYMQYQDRKSKGVESLNHISPEGGIKDVSISGLKVIIKKDDPQGLYKKLYQRSDLKSLSIDAETIEIHDPIHLAQTDITLTAKKIIFIGAGSINTTPLDSIALRAPQFKDGVDGLDAGSIYVHADEIVEDKKSVRFIANGGKGQGAGPGQAGRRGTNAVLKHGYYKYTSHVCHPGTNTNICFDEVERGSPSGNGQNAIVGGKPGEGGQAGKIYINKNFSIAATQTGGVAGNTDSLRLGGAPGSPVTTCAAKFKRRRVRSYDCITAIGGASAMPIKAKRPWAFDKKIQIKRTKASWISSAITPFQYKYIEDLYKAGYLSSSQSEISSLKNTITKNVTGMETKALQQKLTKLSNQMDMRLDFYGNKKTWVPNLGFEVNYMLFKNEVKRNIEVLYLANSMSIDLEKEQMNIQTIKELQSELFENIDAEKKEIDKTIDDIVATNEALGELKTAEEEFHYQLKEVERQIKAKAKRNIKVPFMDKAVKVFAAASKVIPVGQPALGAVGMGVEFFHNATNGSMSAGEILQQAPSMYGQFQELDWKATTKEIHEKLDELSLSHLEGMDSWEERGKHLKKIVDFSSPVFKAVASQMSQWKEMEGGSKLDREIAKIKSSHKMYRKVIEALENLNLKKTLFKDRVIDFQSSMSDALTSITVNYSALAYSFEDIETISIERKRDYMSALDEVKSLASKSLHYYGYLLEKSYEYRLLKDYKSKFNLDILTDEILNLIKTGAGNSVNNIESLEVIYNAKLTEITNELLHVYNDSSAAQTMSKEVSLTVEEINSLNNGQAIYLDTTQANFFGEDKENIRLLDLEVESIKSSGTHAQIEVSMSHSGRSVIDQNSVNFVFDFHHPKTNSALNWRSVYNPWANTYYHSEISANDESLLRNLLDLDSGNSQLFISPGARTFIKVELNKSEQTKINSMRIRMDYSYRIK